MPYKYGRTPLWHACHKGDLAKVKKLYKNGAKDDVTRADNDGQTPMWIACRYNHLDTMKWLYENGAKDDVTKADNDGQTPMWIACRSNKFYIMKWLYENGHKENEDLKNEIKHLKGQMKKVILENEKLKTAANNEITIVRNVDTEKDETISLKRKATSENNNSTSWLSLTSANNQKFKKVKTEFQDKVADLDEKVEDLDENYNYQIQFTNNKLTEIDELKEQIKQLNKEKAVQEKLTSELLKKVKRLGGRE